MSDDAYGQGSGGKSVDILNTRAMAAKAEYVRDLERRADPEALALLVECLCDESWYLRDLAEQTFLRLGERGAPVLIPLLNQGLWFTRASAARVLGRLGHRDAVPGLLELAEDANSSASQAAVEALVAVGRARGAVRIARGLSSLAAETRRRRVEEIAARDRALAERIEHMARNEELMGRGDADALSDDHPAVRATEEGVEWEILTGPPPPKAPGEADPGRG